VTSVQTGAWWKATMTAQPKPGEIDGGTPIAGQRIVNLALQGIGSHGAFTWGVLDRLLEEERLAFDGITATSAGAVNAVVLAYGLAVGGRQGARTALRRYWRRMSAMASAGIFQPSVFDKMYGSFGLDHSPGYLFFDALCQVSSPYLLNPLNYNPLKTLLEEAIDFELLRRQSLVKLFLCATNVRSGKVKIFHSEELRSDHVVASSCHPLMMHAVEIDGEYYWDGGLMGNPALFPVIYVCRAHDIVLVHLTPTEWKENPVTSRAILSRMREVSFNSSLMREMRMVAFVTKLIDDGQLTDGRRIFMHSIDGEEVIATLSDSSWLNGDWNFLLHLHKVGRHRADEWLKSTFDRLNVETTIDVQSKYL